MTNSINSQSLEKLNSTKKDDGKQMPTINKALTENSSNGNYANKTWLDAH